MAKELVGAIRKVTDKPIRHVLLTHYHAVRVLGVAGYEERVNVIASDVTRGMIVERGQQDMDSEIQRFPRLFRAKETIPGLTWPNLVFHERMTLWLGSREVQIIHAGRGHTRGDTIAWLPEEKVLFAGDLVEFGATPYCGDAHFGDWPGTLDRLAAFEPQALVPGRGEALTTPEQVGRGIAETRAFLEDVFAHRQGGGRRRAPAEAGLRRPPCAELRPKYGHWVIFDHCMPFDVSRAYDEAQGHRQSADLDGRARHRDVAGAGERRTVSRALPTSRALPPLARSGRGAAGAASGRDRRRRPGRAGAGGRPRRRGVPCVVVDGKAAFGEGSRGLCYAKRTLEILDRLGVGERAVAKGVTWQLGKVFHGTELLYQFNLLPEGGHKMPAFINLQQYYIEQYLYERCQELPDVDLRFQNKCVGVETFPDHARIDAGDARRRLRDRGRLADRLRRLALDGARSSWACRSRAGCSRTGS